MAELVAILSVTLGVAILSTTYVIRRCAALFCTIQTERTGAVWSLRSSSWPAALIL